MSWNGIRQVGSNEVAQMLADPRSALKELDLRDNQLGTQDALGQAFAEVFQRSPQQGVFNKQLRILNLGNNEFTASGMKLLTQALPAFIALEELFLYHNPEIGSQGAQAISRLLSMKEGEGMPKLLRLVISVCGLKDAGVKALADALRGNDTLIELDISGNNASDASIHMLGEVITHNRTLKTLNLGLNCIGQRGLHYLLESAAARQSKIENDSTEAAPLKIDVSTQAEPNQQDLSSFGTEVLAMFVGFA